MSSLASALAFRRLVDDDATLSLLRADNAAVVLALLARHLGGESRRRPAGEFAELVDAELDELRDEFDLPLTGAAYSAAWRKAGWIVRRPAAGTREETVELSPAATAAVRIAEQIATPRETATESRLMSIRDQVHRLAVESDPDSVRRLELLERERAEIDERIARIRAGDRVDVLDSDRARERLAEILRQAEDVPADFGRVRARFEELNQQLRVSILDSDELQRTVLDNIFLGVDLIESSPEGGTFGAFSALVLDTEVSAGFDDDIGQLLDRDFVAELPVDQRRFLRTFLRTVSAGSGEIHGVLTEFARGLRRYVHSQDFQRDRVLRRSIRRALADAIDAAAELKPFRQTHQLLELSSVSMTSVGAVALHDPSDFAADGEVVDAAVETADLAALRDLARETEIDFVELTENVNAVLAAGAPVSVGDVLTAYPATQGIGSVVGLLALAADHGTVSTESDEVLGWRGADDIDRRARVAVHGFTKEIG